MLFLQEVSFFFNIFDSQSGADAVRDKVLKKEDMKKENGREAKKDMALVRVRGKGL